MVRKSSRRMLWCGVAVTLLTTMVPGGLSAQSPSPSAAVAPSPTAQPRLAGTWVPIADAPIAGRYGHAAVWTGNEMLIWGGSAGSRGRWDKVTRRERGGAAYDPLTDTWRFIARAPIPELSFQVSAWTGTELLVWGRPDGWRQTRDEAIGAAYDPAADDWRRLPDGPLTATGQVAGVWTGTELVVLDGIIDSEPMDISHRLAAYDPAAGTWRRLPDLVSSAPWSVRLAWTGTDLFALASPNQGTSVLYRLDGEAWAPIPTPIDGLSTEATMIWTGTELYVPGGRVLFDAAGGTWRAAAPDDSFDRGRAAWTGSVVLSVSCPAYDPGADQWLSMPASPDRSREHESALWAGDRMIVWGGGDGSDTSYVEPDGIAFIPAAAP